VIRAAVACLLCAASLAVAKPFEWIELATMEDGSVWSYRSGTVSKRSQHIAAVTRRVDVEGGELIFHALVPIDHCGQKRGDVAIFTISGAKVGSYVWATGDQSAGVAIATALCNEYARSKT